MQKKITQIKEKSSKLHTNTNRTNQFACNLPMPYAVVYIAPD